MPSTPRVLLVSLACAVVLVGGTVASSDGSYGARQVACILVPSGDELPALAIPPLPDDEPTTLAFPVEPLIPLGSTTAVLWEDVYGEQHVAVDPTDALRAQLDRTMAMQQASLRLFLNALHAPSLRS